MRRFQRTTHAGSKAAGGLTGGLAARRGILLAMHGSPCGRESLGRDHCPAGTELAPWVEWELDSVHFKSLHVFLTLVTAELQ